MSVKDFITEFNNLTAPAEYSDSISNSEWSCIRRIFGGCVLTELEPSDENSVLLGLIQSTQKGKGLGSSVAFKAAATLQDLANKHQISLRADITPTDGQITPERLQILAHRAGFETVNTTQIDGANAYHVVYHPKSP